MPQIFLKTESPSHCVSQILLLKNDWIVYNIESNQCCVFGVDLSMIIVVVTDYYDFCHMVAPSFSITSPVDGWILCTKYGHYLLWFGFGCQKSME